MPGAWEKGRPEVMVATLTRGIVPVQWASAWRDLQLPAEHRSIRLSGMPFDHARNTAVKRCLEFNFEWLFFIDDDVVVPPDAYIRLRSHEADIISGLYYRRALPIQPVAMLRNADGSSRYAAFNPGETVEVDLVGAGCLLIHSRVLREMKPPWFEWKLDHENLAENQKVSEDFDFCIKAKALGFQIFLDTMVQCEHVGQGKSFVGGRFEPVGA